MPILATNSKETIWMDLSDSASTEKDAKLGSTDTIATNHISTARFADSSDLSRVNWGKLSNSFLDLEDFVCFVPTDRLFKSYKSLQRRRMPQKPRPVPPVNVSVFVSSVGTNHLTWFRKTELSIYDLHQVHS